SWRKHNAPIACSEDRDYSEVYVADEPGENICDKYDTESDGIPPIDCSDQDMISVISSMVQSEEDAYEFSNSMVSEVDQWDCREEAATSFWALAESDEEDFCYVDDHVTPHSSYAIIWFASQSDSKLFQQHINNQQTGSRSNAPRSSSTESLFSGKEMSDLIHAHPQEKIAKPPSRATTGPFCL
ncbi:hypothetical protein BGZ95_008472, partial [Linnemannia exigua]